MFVQHSIKQSEAVYELSCCQTFMPYHAMAKLPKIWSCDLDLDLDIQHGSRGCQGTQSCKTWST